MVRVTIAFSLAAAVALAGCKTDNMTDGVKSAGSAVVDGAKDAARGAVSLVNVDLSNVLNDLALDLKVDKSNIPINAQIPVTVAANVCGVSINIFSIGAGGGNSQGCTANSISPELKQYIQQQMAANGNVGGGAQTNTGSTGATTSGTSTTTTTSPPQQDPNAQPPQ